MHPDHEWPLVKSCGCECVFACNRLTFSRFLLLEHLLKCTRFVSNIVKLLLFSIKAVYTLVSDTISCSSILLSDKLTVYYSFLFQVWWKAN